MADSSALKDAANRLMIEARRFIEAVETEEAASANAPVPAHMVNMPPETRAARPDVAALSPTQVTDADTSQAEAPTPTARQKPS